MRNVRVDAKDLMAGLNLAMLPICRASAVPVLGLVRITSVGPSIRLSGTDLDSFVETSVAAQVTSSIDVLVQPRILQRFLRGVEGDIDIEVSGDTRNQTIALSRGRSSVTFYCDIDAHDQPKIKTFRLESRAEISEAELHRALSLTKTCVSSEETRYYLNGVFFTEEGGFLTLEAMDGFRLMRVVTAAKYSGESFILPSSAVQIALKMINKNGNGAVNIVKNGKHTVVISTARGSLTAKAVDGGFPTYRKSIPGIETRMRVLVSPVDLRTFSTGKLSEGILISPENGTIIQRCSEGHEVVAGIAVGKGEDFKVNPALLKPLVSAIGAATLTSNSQNEPILISGSDKAVTCVLMPLRFL